MIHRPMKVIRYKKVHPKRYPDVRPPERASSGAVGYDVRVYYVLDRHKDERPIIQELPATVPPSGAMLFGTGIAMAVDFPYDCQIRPRSGLANKFDVELSNAPGTIDPDYRGEAGILLRNRGKKPFRVKYGDRVAQLIFTEAVIPRFVERGELPKTSRDVGGFGSTGTNAIALGEKEYLQEQLRWDKFFMKVAIACSDMSNCLRGAQHDPNSGAYLRKEDGSYFGSTRKFGCVIVKDGNIASFGYNHTNAECHEGIGCVREREKILSGTSLERGCYHAEQVALSNHNASGGPSLVGATVYVNAEPCLMCSKLIVRSGIGTVVAPKAIYDNNGLNFLSDAGVDIRQLDLATLNQA
ncbi:MAG: dUTP diphosphatase [Parcubacteria group bacterium]